ncbi:MAG TPA: pilin [Candidatus Paceibacterota bacterium]|nr:pilin [Candidatus Paceibacterota bacterium]
MKTKHLFILLLLVTLGIKSPTFAQSNNTNSVSQCEDGVDNENPKDGQIDRNGRTVNGVKYPPDENCKDPNAICEDGTRTCILGARFTNTGTKSAPASGASDFDLKVRINNPLKVDTIEGAIQLFMNMVLRIALPFIIVFFIWSGLNFILARGNAEKIKTAKKMFWYTIIGSLLILGAWTITNAIIGTVNSITG